VAEQYRGAGAGRGGGVNVILAGNCKQAENFAREKGWSRKEYVIASHWSKVMGLENFTVWKIGTFSWRDDYRQMMDIIATRQGVTYGRE